MFDPTQQPTPTLDRIVITPNVNHEADRDESLVMHKQHARKFPLRPGWALDSRDEAGQGSHLPFDSGGIGSKGCRHDGLFTGVAGIQAGVAGIRTGAARIRDQIDQL